MVGSPGQIAAQSVNTDFIEIGKTLFDSANAYGPWTMWAGELPMEGTKLTGYMLGALPASAQIVGERKFSAFRKYARTVEVNRYGPEGLEIPIVEIEGDKTGAVRGRLAAYLRQNRDLFAKPMHDFLVSNPTCIDASALIATTHPFDSGGSTWSNSTSNSLSMAELATVVQAMRGRLGETGISLGIEPTHLMVPPGTQQLALDITGSTRPVSVNSSGAIATSAVVAAVSQANWLAGSLDVIVNPYMTSGTYFVMALSNADVKPVYFGVAVPPAAHVIDDPGSDNVKYRSTFAYYAEGQAALLGGVPQCIYGKAS